MEALKGALPEEEEGAQPLHIIDGRGKDADHLLPEDEDWKRQEKQQKRH